MAEDFGFVPDPPKKKEGEGFGFIPDDPASQTKREYVEQGGKLEDVYSPERAKILVEKGPEALIAEPPLQRGDGSIAGPTLPTEEALAKGLIEKRAEPAVRQALADGVNTVSSGYDQEKDVGFAVGKNKDGQVVRVEKKPDDLGFVPDEPKKKADDFGFVPDEPRKEGLQPMSEYQRPDPNKDDPTFAGALGRGAARSAFPTAAGIAGGILTGAAIGAVTTGPAAIVGAPIGGLLGGLAFAFGAEKLQDYALENVVSPETKKAIDDQFAKDAEKQPVASFAGQVAPSFLLFRPSPSNLAKAGAFSRQIMSGQITKEALESPAVREQASNLLNVAFGVGTQTSLEAAGQIERGEFEPLRLGASVVIGALQTEPTRLGRATIVEPMTRLDQAIRAKQAAKVEAQGAGAGNANGSGAIGNSFNDSQQSVTRLDSSPIDIEYRQAVESGDLVKAQEMVDQEASRAGYDTKAFRGDRDANIYDYTPSGGIERVGAGSWSGSSARIFMAQDAQRAGKYGQAREFYVNRERHLDASNATDLYGKDKGFRKIVDSVFEEQNLGRLERQEGSDYRNYTKSDFISDIDSGRAWNIEGTQTAKAWKAFVNKVADSGYDSMSVMDGEGEAGGVSLIVFKPQNLKLSDSVLYDSSGNLVPLSQRFNRSVSDVRGGRSITEPQNQEQAQPEDPFALTDDRTEIPTQMGFANPEQKKKPSDFIVREDSMDRPDILGGPDVIDYIRELGGILPKGRAQAEKNLRLYGNRSGSSIKRLQEAGSIPEYDGATNINAGYRKEIAGTIAPDEMAQMLLDNYGIGDGSVDSLWGSISKAIETRNNNRRSLQDFRKAGRQEKAFVGNVLKPKNQNKESVTAGQFYKGDKFVAGGEDFMVSDISPDTGAVTLTDGDKYGTQIVRPDTSLFTDTKPVPPNAKQSTPPSEPPPPARPPTQPTPEPQPTPEQRPTIRQRLKAGLDNFRRIFQDKFVDIENLQKRIEKGKFGLPDAVNIKQSEELFHGRVGERLTSFEEGQVRPIIEDLRNTGIDPATFEKYAIAKHARERNAVIAGRNPNMPDGGSGMTNAEADRLLAGGIPLDVQAKLEPVRQKLLDINRSTINNLLEGGLISAETHDLLTKRYKDYVPLRGTKNRGVDGGTEFEAARITGTGSGLDVRGRDIIRAGGRESMANDILAYAVSQNMDSIVRSEKNRVLLTAARFAKSFKDNGVIVEVKPSEVMKTIRYEEDGQTRFAKTIDPYLADAPDIIAYKENGETKYLRINDPRLADVMKNRASPVLGSVIERLGSLNRYFALINTQASPEFVVSNFARDLQTALVNINSDQAQGLARGLVKNIAPALKATYRAELGKPDLGGRMDVFYRQFRAAGGKMTFFGLKDFQTLQKQIQSKLAGGGSNAGARVFRLVLDRVGQLNSAVENATRLATFATLRERGYTDQQAAYAARNITVNFTRKGTAGSLMNAFYLFFNANIQGSARIIQALATSKKVQKIALGAMTFGFFRDMVNRIVGGEDETGMPIYDKIPEYQRRQNIIVMNPFSEEMGIPYFKVPMPYGYSVFDYAGQLVADTMPSDIYGGGKKPMDSAVNLTLAAIDNFNPLGGSYSLLQAIAPTITTPFVDSALNQDFSGRPIMPTPNPFDPVPPPDSQRYWNNVNPASKWVAEKLNELTGGSKVRAGYIDVSPETLDYGYEFLTGAVGKFGERVMMAPIRAARVAAGQEDVTDLIGEIPMARKVTGSVPSFVDVKRYQDMRTEILTVDRELKLARKAGDTERAREIVQDARPELSLVNMIKATEQDLKELRSQRRRLQELDKNRTNPAIQKRLDANRERQKALMIRALKLYNSSIDEKM